MSKSKSGKHPLRNKYVLLLVVAFVVGVGGTIAYKSKTDNFLNQTTTTSESTTTTNENAANAKKEDQGNPSTTVTTKKSTTTAPVAPSNQANLASLSATLTATKSATDNTISLSFYMEPGQYTVQEFTMGVWRNTTENIFYPGSGGFPGATMSASESQKKGKNFEKRKRIICKSKRVYGIKVRG